MKRLMRIIVVGAALVAASTWDVERHLARAQTTAPAAAPVAAPITPPVAAPGVAPGVAPANTDGSKHAPTGIVVEDSELDLANIVTSAAKGVTTVQEAPAIITIITAEEIKQRGYRDIGQVLGSIPGWIDSSAEGNQVSLPLVRGTVQAVLYLRDGVSFFDPAFNIAALNRSVPLETIKRLEVVTGPGGVLWGANSYLGVVNVISKDADDVRWGEFSVGYGDGRGNASDLRAYAMFGHSFFKNRLKIFLHASYENYVGAQFEGRQYYVASPTPQPLGPAEFGASGTVQSDIARSWIVNAGGKISLGPVSLYFNVPFGEMNFASTFGPTLLVMDRGADGRVCNYCDRSTWNFYDRYGILEYRDRFANQKVGIDAKIYYIQFVRDILFRVFPSSTGLPGGLSAGYPSSNVARYGGNIDFDWSGPFTWNRLLAGAELFHESASGSGPNGSITTIFPQPADSTLLPLACPLDANGKVIPQCPTPFIYGGAERTVAGVFVADQIRPYSKLTLDGGVRYQQGFGKLSYAPQILGSAAAVWQFLPDVHLKLNFSQGFRPPVFNNTNGNGGSVQFAGNPNLRVETSESYSAEVNARLLRNVKNVRELQLRLDYAYTLLDDVIVVRGGSYSNSGRRAIHSVEFLGKLYLQGDHFLSLAYTFQQIATSDTGDFRSVPRNYLQLGASFSIIKRVLDVNSNISVFGGADDPNRVPTSAAALPGGMATIAARITDFTYDRLPPVALLQIGARLRLWNEHFALSAQLYNVLNQRYYAPDVFFDQTPIIESRPNPAPAFSFFTSLTYRP